MELRKWVGGNKLLEIPTSNENFTQNNRRKDFNYIEEKLNRFFLKEDLANMDLTIQVTIQPMTCSGHYQIKIEFEEPKKPFRNPFKCQKMCSQIKTSWNA